MYDQSVYLLDLCILSYQLHAQTLIWPFDPYYEFSKNDGRRAEFLDALHFGAQGRGEIHGPGGCQGTHAEGWATNNTLEPVFSDYRRIYPWRPSFTRPDGENEPWVVYDTPSLITNRIGKVNMARYSPKAGPYHKDPIVQIDVIHAAHPSPPTTALLPDVLYCFEGGTGAVYGDASQSGFASWSMMGFVLAHQLAPSDPAYDLYIVFRGSRSGKLRPMQAGSGKGNPDWVTDLQIMRKPVEILEIAGQGKCVKGFSASLLSMLPTVMASVQQVHADKQGRPPRAIFVTGHSLGGALACLFSSAIINGTAYGPNAKGKRMPKELSSSSWPWDSIRLVSFSAPAVGGETFRQALDSVCPGNRIYVKGDIITIEVPGRTYAVGIERKLKDKHRTIGSLNPHEPLAVRRLLVEELSVKDRNEYTKVPMATRPDEPWKLFTSAGDMLAALAKSPGPGGLAALIPNCENFLQELLDRLPILYPPDSGEVKEIGILSTELRRVLRDKTYNAFTGVRSLCGTWKQFNTMYNQRRTVYSLLGFGLFFNALSKDSTIYTDSDQFNMIKSLIGEWK